jgi:hypothetical protein
MTKNPLQWNEVGRSYIASSDVLGANAISNSAGNSPSATGSGMAISTSDPPSGLAKESTLAEAVDSIGKDCTQQVESYLERCKTNQEGE